MAIQAVIAQLIIASICSISAALGKLFAMLPVTSSVQPLDDRSLFQRKRFVSMVGRFVLVLGLSDRSGSSWAACNASLASICSATNSLL